MKCVIIPKYIFKISDLFSFKKRRSLVNGHKCVHFNVDSVLFYNDNKLSPDGKKYKNKLMIKEIYFFIIHMLSIFSRLLIGNITVKKTFYIHIFESSISNRNMYKTIELRECGYCLYFFGGRGLFIYSFIFVQVFTANSSNAEWLGCRLAQYSARGVWVRLCRRRSQLRRNTLPHCSQL